MRSSRRKQCLHAARGAARSHLAWAFSAAILACVLAESALADDAKIVREPLPEGNHGIAAMYPGDAGIERDARVVFTESFEEDSRASMSSRWEDVSNPERMTFADEVPPGSRGKHSMVLEKQLGSTQSGAGLYRRIKNSENGWGYDQLFAVLRQVCSRLRGNPPLWHDPGWQLAGDAVADGQGRHATWRQQVVLDGHRAFRTNVDVGLLHLLVRDARQPPCRQDVGQQLHSRPEAHD